jgi:hypothetical protein
VSIIAFRSPSPIDDGAASASLMAVTKRDNLDKEGDECQQPTHRGLPRFRAAETIRKRATP